MIAALLGSFRSPATSMIAWAFAFCSGRGKVLLKPVPPIPPGPVMSPPLWSLQGGACAMPM